DPIRLTQDKYEYLVVPDIRHPRAMEVYSIDQVQSTNLDTRETRDYKPFYSLQHGQENPDDLVYWYARRQPSMRAGDNGWDVYLALVDPQFNPRLPAADVVTLRATCTNRDL